jgi:membrane protein
MKKVLQPLTCRIANTPSFLVAAEELFAGVAKVKSCRFNSGRDKQRAKMPAAETIRTKKAFCALPARPYVKPPIFVHASLPEVRILTQCILHQEPFNAMEYYPSPNCCGGKLSSESAYGWRTTPQLTPHHRGLAFRGLMKFIDYRKLREQLELLLDEKSLRPEKELPRLHKFLHFWVLVWQSFSRNRCPARASALAYANLLALIPMLAVVLGITSSFLKSEGEQRIDRFVVKGILSVLPRSMFSTNTVDSITNNTEAPSQSGGTAESGPAESTLTNAQSTNALNTAEHKHHLLPSSAQEAQVLQARRLIAHRIHEFISNTRSSALGVTGSIALIFAAISMLSQIETTFNDIWGTSRGRGYFTRVALYWTVLSLGPLLLAVAITLTTGTHWSWTQKLIRHFPFAANMLFKAIPVLVLCVGLALFYRLMPNTKVHWNAALIGGLVGGVLWHLNNLVSVLYVSRVVSNSLIYGSLGLIPVFMIGLYLVWWILLFGAQVAYAFQNRASFVEQRQVEHLGQRARELLALRLMAWIGRRFLRGQSPLNVFEMAKELELPTRLIQQVMQVLCNARLVTATAGPDVAYFPARPLTSISCHEILLAMRDGRDRKMAFRREPSSSKVYGLFATIENAQEQVAGRITLQDLAEISRAGLRSPEEPSKADKSHADNTHSLTE